MAIIEFDNVSFSYDDKRSVLHNASFAVREGEFVALVGLNGSGKSTVAKLVDAFLAPDSGRICTLGYDIEEIAGTDKVFELRRNVGFVFQNPDDQLAATLVVDEVAFGPRNLGIAKEDIVRRVDGALTAVGMSDAVGQDVNTLSGGQKQRIAIADALAMQPKLIVLDEPTSMLDTASKHEVMQTIKRLHENGITILLVTHDPHEAALADRVLMVQDKKVVEIQELDALNRKASWHRAPSTKSPNETQPKQSPIVEFNDVSFHYDGAQTGIDIFSDKRDDRLVLENVSLAVFPAETLAITGPNGSGKTTLVQHMNGLLKPSSGEVFVNGISTSSKTGANAARKTVGISFQYPERSLFAETVHEDIAFGPTNIGLSQAEIEERVHESLTAVGLSYDKFAERNPFSLSGGEQRKVAIAGVLAMRPEVLVLDEPCASMDAPTHDHFIELFLGLKAAGQTIVIVTHDENDIEILADRTYYSKR